MNSMKKMIVFLFAIVVSLSSFGQSESLKIPWPAGWKQAFESKTQVQDIAEFTPGNETLEKWTILGTMMNLRGMNNIPIDMTMNMMFSDVKKNASNPTMTLVEKKTDGKNPWIIFKIEGSGTKKTNEPLSTLYYIISGQSGFFNNSVAIKESSLSKDFVDKWAGIFKASEIIK
jgi:hypothetical protein